MPVTELEPDLDCGVVPVTELERELDCGVMPVTEPEPVALFVGLSTKGLRETEAVKPKGFLVASGASVLPMAVM